MMMLTIAMMIIVQCSVFTYIIIICLFDILQLCQWVDLYSNPEGLQQLSTHPASIIIIIIFNVINNFIITTTTTSQTIIIISKYHYTMFHYLLQCFNTFKNGIQIAGILLGQPPNICLANIL